MKKAKKSPTNKKSLAKKSSRSRRTEERRQTGTHTSELETLEHGFPLRPARKDPVERYMLNEVEYIRTFGYRI